MKFFTHDWAGEAVPAKYQAHLSTLLPRMPATIRALAQGVNIHDGRLRAATLDRARHTLALSMRCGDNQVGYFDLDLVYYEAVLRDKDVAALREVSRDLKAEAQYDELDLTDAGAWLHRMTFWRDHEVTVCFGRLALRLQPMPNRDFLRLPDVYVEVPSDAPFPGTGSLVGASRAGRLGYPLSVSPTILRVRGFRFYFFSREERRAHVHVQHADGEAKFRIEPAVELHGNYGLKPKQIAEAENLIKEHLNEIRRAWATHFPG